MSRIIQIVPCPIPMHACYCNTDGTIHRQQVILLAIERMSSGNSSCITPMVGDVYGIDDAESDSAEGFLGYEYNNVKSLWESNRKYWLKRWTEENTLEEKKAVKEGK